MRGNIPIRNLRAYIAFETRTSRVSRLRGYVGVIPHIFVWGSYFWGSPASSSFSFFSSVSSSSYLQVPLVLSRTDSTHPHSTHSLITYHSLSLTHAHTHTQPTHTHTHTVRHSSHLPLAQARLTHTAHTQSSVIITHSLTHSVSCTWGPCAGRVRAWGGRRHSHLRTHPLTPPPPLTRLRPHSLIRIHLYTLCEKIKYTCGVIRSRNLRAT